ncbi:Uncharacterised protein [Rhodococcus wratislaviensis]|uniref:Restriction endonuclease type IV Mrr domain-containing protein n=2 Tax=Rhodococcus wratislaviensis TaxID=44752 RepID=A0AB38FFQ0_RHOWR|nr:Uncharacterised protein [Rhodococcus wratislaviensis]
MSKQLLFFSASGYSRHAIEYANEHGICLFSYDLFGNVAAVNPSARRLAPRTSSAGSGFWASLAAEWQFVLLMGLFVWLVVAWIASGSLAYAFGYTLCPAVVVGLIISGSQSTK